MRILQLQKEIEDAAKYSYADEFIKKLPEKYDTLIGENGVRLLVEKNRGYLLLEQYSKKVR